MVFRTEHARLRGFRILLALVIPTMIGMHTSIAQEFKKVIEIVGDMEDSLRVRLDLEQATRHKEVSALQEQIANLQITLAQTQQDARTRDSLLNALAAKPAPPIAPPAPAYPTVKVGVLSQFQVSALEEKTSAAQDANPNYTPHWSRQMALRRMRVLVGVNLSAATSLFFESDSPTLGQVGSTGTKDIKLSMFVQDAYVQHTFMPELSVLTGYQLVGITRNGLQSAASLLPANYGSYTFLTASPLDTYVGRDIGIALRGFLLDERLEYRAGVYNGRNTNTFSSPRQTFRLHYNFEDREKGFFYTGTTLGKGKIFSLGAGLDIQGSYMGYAIDGFYDSPLFGAGSITASASYAHYDGGGSDTDSTYFTGSIPRQDVLFFEAGYLFKEWNVQPIVKYESQTVDAEVLRQVGAATAEALKVQNKLKSGGRIGVGLNYFVSGHNLNVKAMYELVTRNRLAVNGQPEEASATEFVLQLQYFVF